MRSPRATETGLALLAVGAAAAAMGLQRQPLVVAADMLGGGFDAVLPPVVDTLDARTHHGRPFEPSSGGHAGPSTGCLLCRGCAWRRARVPHARSACATCGACGPCRPSCNTCSTCCRRGVHPLANATSPQGACALQAHRRSHGAEPLDAAGDLVAKGWLLLVGVDGT
jgi:hypothetical protein